MINIIYDRSLICSRHVAIRLLKSLLKQSFQQLLGIGFHQLYLLIL